MNDRTPYAVAGLLSVLTLLIPVDFTWPGADMQASPDRHPSDSDLVTLMADVPGVYCFVLTDGPEVRAMDCIRTDGR